MTLGAFEGLEHRMKRNGNLKTKGVSREGDIQKWEAHKETNRSIKVGTENDISSNLLHQRKGLETYKEKLL
jgi:hypothetical protein